MKLRDCPEVKIKFVQGDTLPNLDIELDSGFSGPLSWHHANDNTRSIMLIGPTNRLLKCYNAKEGSIKEGELHVWVEDEFVTRVDRLDKRVPESEPNVRAEAKTPPGGQREVLHNIEHFEGEISSLRFDWKEKEE